MCACHRSVPRYKLLLEQLLKFTASSHPDLPLLTAALTQISVTASAINEAVRRREAMDAMVAIEERFMSSPGFVHASRVFLRQATLTKVGRSGAAKQEHFFLFNDMLASARSVVGRYVLKKKVMIDSHFALGSELATQHAAHAPPTRYGLLLLYRDGGCLSLYFQQAAEKAAWLADIERCIAQAANSIPVQAADKERDREQQQQQSDGSSQSSEGDRERGVWKERDEEKDGSAGSSSSAADRQCALCSCSFTLFNRRHNCRQCGRAVCGDCSRSRLILHTEERRPERVCDGCALSAEPPRAAVSMPSKVNANTSPLVQPSSPSSSSSSRSLSSRGVAGFHQHSPSYSFNASLPSQNLSEHTPQMAISPSSSSSNHSSAGAMATVIAVDCVSVAVAQQARRTAAHTRAASSSTALLLSAASEPAGPYPPVSEWDCATLLRWLCEPEIGFEEFVEGFAKFHMDGPLLLELTDDELRDEIGIKEQLHRKRLRRLIERFALGPPLSASPQPLLSPKVNTPSSAINDRTVSVNWKAGKVNFRSATLNTLATDFSTSAGIPVASASAPILPALTTLSSSASAVTASLGNDAVGPPAGAGINTPGSLISGPSGSAPAMPKRAAPSLPQRQRNTAISERRATPAAENKADGRCIDCGQWNGLAVVKFCSSCTISVSEQSRDILDERSPQAAYDFSSTLTDGRISFLSSRRRSSHSVAMDSIGSVTTTANRSSSSEICNSDPPEQLLNLDS